MYQENEVKGKKKNKENVDEIFLNYKRFSNQLLDSTTDKHFARVFLRLKLEHRNSYFSFVSQVEM